MPHLQIHPERVTPEAARLLTALCPFGAIQYTAGSLDITAGCKMCRMCVNKGPAGVITLEEDAPAPAVDKTAWRGVAVFVEHRDGQVHNVTLELLGKARELAAVTGQPVYGVMLGHGVGQAAESLLAYGADKVYLYDDPALRHFLMEPYANALEDFISKVRPVSYTHLDDDHAVYDLARHAQRADQPSELAVHVGEHVGPDDGARGDRHGERQKQHRARHVVEPGRAVDHQREPQPGQVGGQAV